MATEPEFELSVGDSADVRYLRNSRGSYKFEMTALENLAEDFETAASIVANLVERVAELEARFAAMAGPPDDGK